MHGELCEAEPAGVREGVPQPLREPNTERTALRLNTTRCSTDEKAMSRAPQYAAGIRTGMYSQEWKQNISFLFLVKFQFLSWKIRNTCFTVKKCKKITNINDFFAFFVQQIFNMLNKIVCISPCWSIFDCAI